MGAKGAVNIIFRGQTQEEMASRASDYEAKFYNPVSFRLPVRFV